MYCRVYHRNKVPMIIKYKMKIKKESKIVPWTLINETVDQYETFIVKLI